MPAEPQQSSQSARLDQLEPGDPAQQLARLRAHALRVGEVAGVVVGDLHLDRAALGARAGLGEELGHVAHARGEAPPRARPSRVRRAGRGRSPSSPSRSRPHSRRRSRSAPAPRWSPWRAPAPPRPRRRASAAPRSSAAGAARAPRSPRRRAPARWPRSRGRRTRAARSPGAARPSPRFSPRASKRSGSRASERSSDASGVIEIIAASRGASRRTRGRRASRGRPSFCASAAAGRQRAQPPRPGEQLEDQPPVRALERRALEVALELRARVLDQLVVLHPGRAGGHARHAAEAAVEVRHERRRDLVVPLLHQHDPPARRVHLLAPEHVRRAGRQAEAAVHAVADQVELRARASSS